MEYRSVINHPQNGEMRNRTESAKYLGISKRKFPRIAPPPDHMQDGIYPFWSRRILDILLLSEDFDPEGLYKRGKACGNFLIGDMNDEEIEDLRNALKGSELSSRIRNHLCGIDEKTDGKSLTKKAAWAMLHCNCPSTTPRDETVFILQGYKVPITFRSNREAKVFRDGILSAIKDYVAERMRTRPPSPEIANLS